MDLINIAPQESTFIINNETFTMRLFSALDTIKMQQEIGVDALSEAFSGDNLELLLRIVYNQLKFKEKFAPIETKEFDENGIEQTIVLGGWKLFASMINGTEDQVKIYKAFVETIGFSYPDKEDENEEIEKKK